MLYTVYGFLKSRPEMAKSSCINLDTLIEHFVAVEKKIRELTGKNNILEMELDNLQRVIKFALSKEKSYIEERDTIVTSVNTLQQSLQQQSHLRVENEKLKEGLADLTLQQDRTAEAHKAELQRMATTITVAEESHKRALETVREECRRQVEDIHKQRAARESEVERYLESKDLELEEMRRSLSNQEKERQNELLKLQMEFGVKLAKVQSTAQRSRQQHQQDSSVLPQNIFKRKLQFFQEEKNREIEGLRQRIKELEKHHVYCPSDKYNKRKKI